MEITNVLISIEQQLKRIANNLDKIEKRLRK